ncbi:MAG: hypothetical protein RBT15_07555 [Gudongella sp.]|jgi:hypothetical protein|nr:hypothetical protein [Gudongella sp.]
MVIDHRKKLCPNENCEMHNKKVLQNSDIDYCQKCGTKLNFVCTKCLRVIDSKGIKHRICHVCEAEKEQKRVRRKEKLKSSTVKTGAVIVTVATPIVKSIFDTMIDDSQGKVTKLGTKAIKAAVKTVFKK